MHTSVPSKNGLVSPGDSNKREGARAIRVAGHGGADRACASRSPVLTGEESPSRSIVDWFTVTFSPVPGQALALNIHSLLLRCMGEVSGVAVPAILGYEHGVKFCMTAHGALINVGRLDWGGEHHKGRARLDLTGTGCAQVDDWSLIHREISKFDEVALTRVDLAVDCLQGEFTVDDALAWYGQGAFNCGGRNPRHSTPGDWANPNYAAGEGLRYGRTLEIGRRANGKMLRAYEKGRQLGSSDSPWTRFEVEIRNIDRDIPLDILVNPDKYFAGAYKCLAKLLLSPIATIPTHQKEGQITLERLTHFARVGYGKLIEVLRVHLSANEIIQELARPGLPRRLEKSVLTGFLPAASPGIT